MRPRPVRRVRWGAIGVSLLVHAAVGVALLGSASGRFVGADGPGVDQGVMAVTLVARASAPDASTPDPSAGRLALLLARSDTGAPPEYLAPAQPQPGRMDQLLERVRRQEGPTRQPPADTPRAQPPAETLDTGTADRSLTAAGARATGEQAAAQPGGGGGLWGLVAPCWRRVSGGTKVWVILEVTLDARGRVGKPPRIVRAASSAVDEARLRAEAQALAALAACAPQSDLRLANRTYRLEFMPGA